MDFYVKPTWTNKQINRSMTLGISYVESLQSIIGHNAPDNAALQTWIDMAQSFESWYALSRNWIERQQAVALHAYGHHLLLENGLSDHSEHHQVVAEDRFSQFDVH